MEKKFTKGEWELDADFIFSENDEVICDTNPIGITKTVFRRSEEEFLANGRLIAAAPEMIDVLSTIENDNGEIPDWLWKRIKDVIKKATE